MALCGELALDQVMDTSWGTRRMKERAEAEEIAENGACDATRLSYRRPKYNYWCD